MTKGIPLPKETWQPEFCEDRDMTDEEKDVLWLMHKRLTHLAVMLLFIFSILLILVILDVVHLNSAKAQEIPHSPLSSLA